MNDSENCGGKTQKMKRIKLMYIRTYAFCLYILSLNLKAEQKNYLSLSPYYRGKRWEIGKAFIIYGTMVYLKATVVFIGALNIFFLK